LIFKHKDPRGKSITLGEGANIETKESNLWQNAIHVGVRAINPILPWKRQGSLACRERSTSLPSLKPALNSTKVAVAIFTARFDEGYRATKTLDATKSSHGGARREFIPLQGSQPEMGLTSGRPSYPKRGVSRGRVAQAFELSGTTTTGDAPLFAYFAKGGYGAACSVGFDATKIS
jgi:hypothetical protein